MTEYDIQYTTIKEIKGSVLSDHLSHQALDDYQSMNFKFPDENIILVMDCKEPRMYEGIAVVIISTKGFHMPFTT